MLTWKIEKKFNLLVQPGLIPGLLKFKYDRLNDIQNRIKINIQSRIFEIKMCYPFR